MDASKGSTLKDSATKALLRFLIVMATMFLVAPAVSAQEACNARDLSLINKPNVYADTVDRRVTIDSVTNQKITTFRVRITSFTGVTSQKRICITKEQGELREPLRPPQPLPPMNTEAPPKPQETASVPPVVIPKSRSCWRWSSWCPWATLAGVGGVAYIGYECVTDWCKGGSITVNDNSTATAHSGSHQRYPAQRGFQVSVATAERAVSKALSLVR